MSNIDKQALNQEKIEWLNKLADMEYCKSNPGHWLMSLKDTNMLAKLALRSVSLLDELEAKDKSIDFLKEQLAQLANFNPDWDKLEAATDSLRERIAKLSSAEKRIAELEALAFNPALLDVIAERQRQMSVEGWTPKHDDKHDNNELAFAASCYAFHSAAASWDFEDDGTPYDIHPAPKNWPWSPEWWKPKNPRRDLVKAGALILAEIERIDRAAAGKGETS
ncbi:ead/Ea22-like family protein [Enterobacter asburiae]|uniref:ead/Ea22-like family protein n=1 Tax=Enterobacter asburiae TaxID=61645 RepID=UPI000ABF679E|nr:ead/Ea22-like family protein [Enterobacter asburiae]